MNEGIERFLKLCLEGSLTSIVEWVSVAVLKSPSAQNRPKLVKKVLKHLTVREFSNGWVGK